MMRIAFTGASSFTGYWFINALCQAGHEVIAVFQSSRKDYDGIRAQRVERLVGLTPCMFECPFGGDAFRSVVESVDHWDVFCHHVATVGNYRDPDFDVCGAVTANTLNFSQVLRALTARGCNRVVVTGSVFESGEGAGSAPLRAFSPYGLSKGLTFDLIKFYCEEAGVSLGKFIIPNPFGPYEEPRFTSFLMRSWFKGEIPEVRTPDYVRDNIHVSLLAKAYAAFVEGQRNRCSPSGYVETQGAFAQRFGEALGGRLNIPCLLDFAVQEHFPEPRVRINTEVVEGKNWCESAAWDELAQYYAAQYLQEVSL